MSTRHLSRNMNSLIIGMASTLYLGFYISGCKPLMPKSDSDLQTLDDFADRNATNLNVCSGNQGALQGLVDRVRVGRDFQSCGGANSSAACEAARSTLTAVPKEVQSAYLALGGSFLFTDKEKVVEICRNALQDKEFAESEVRKISGCIAFDLDSAPGANNKLVIVVENDQALIKHNLVRLFGYLWTQFIPNVSQVNGRYIFDPSLGLDQRAVNLQNDIAVNFFKDIYDREKMAGLKKLESLLGSDALPVMEQRLAANSQSISFDQLFAASGSNPSPSLFNNKRRLQALKDTVFAEAFDSMNCNGATLESARARFSLSFQTFSTISQAIIARAIQISGGSMTALAAAEEQPSLALDATTDLQQMQIGMMLGSLLGRSLSSGGMVFNRFNGTNTNPNQPSNQAGNNNNSVQQRAAQQAGASGVGGCPNSTCGCVGKQCSGNAGTTSTSAAATSGLTKVDIDVLKNNSGGYIQKQTPVSNQSEVQAEKEVEKNK